MSEKRDANDILRDEGADALRQAFDQAAKTQWTGNEPLPYIDISTWDDVRPPVRGWAVYDRIPLRQPTLLSGHGATGKSMLMLQLLAATSLSRDWIGLLPEPGPTIYLGAEDDTDELHRRLEHITKHYGVRYRDLIDGGFKLLSYAGEDMLLGIADRQGRVQPTDLYHRLYRDSCKLRPKLVVLDASSDVYLGNESERGPVRQFMGLCRHLAIGADCGVILAAHPSLTGLNSGSGLSGTTQWHNSVRSRMYLKATNDDEESEGPDNGLRELQFMKNQYGPIGTSIRLHWKDGLYLPVPSQSTLDALAAERKVDDLFLTLLRRLAEQGRNVSPYVSSAYAASLFASEPEAKKSKTTKKAFVEAMARLFEAKKIRAEEVGSASRRRSKIVEADPSNEPSNGLPTPSNEVLTHTPHTPLIVGRGKGGRWKPHPFQRRQREERTVPCDRRLRGRDHVPRLRPG
jgi:RecA-family ATPase